MPSIITFAQTDVLKDFCNSLMPVATESYIDRALPIADIDSQGRQQVPMDNLKASITEIDDEEWQMTAGHVAGPQAGAPNCYSTNSCPKRNRTGDPQGYWGTCCPYTTYWRRY